MTDKEFFVYTLKDELPRFERMFKAVEEVPEDKLSYKPETKSRTAFELVSLLAMESGMFPMILESGKFDFMSLPKPSWKTVGEALDFFMKNMKKTMSMSEKMDQKDWDSKAEMYTGDKLEWETTVGKMIWSFLLDAIHHRGQLSTYLRPMGGKVPSIYGPSADTQ